MHELIVQCNTLSLVLLMILALFVTACTPKADKENEPTPVLSGRPNTNYPLPPISRAGRMGQLGWDLSDGQRVTIATYQNKVLVLDFYATWCMPCRESIPHLLDLEKRFGPQGLAIVGLNVGGPEDLFQVSSFAQEFNIDYPLAVPEKALSDLLLADSDAIPQTFVFDRRGQLAKRFIGYSSSTASELERSIGEALTMESR